MSQTKLHILEYPKPAPKIVLLHGLGGTHRYWMTGLEDLKKHYHVILVDLLGFGDSDKPWINYSRQAHVEALHKALQHFDHFYLVGHSLGAALSLALATKYPLQIKGLILISLPFYLSQDKAYRWLRQTPSGWLMTNLVTAILTCIFTRRVVGKFLPRILKQFPKEVSEDLLKHHFISSTTSLWQVLYNSAIDSNARAIPNHIRVLCIHALNDDTAPYESVKQLVQEHRQWTLRTLNHSGHHPWLWDNQACVNAVTNIMDNSN